jgi:hypothetical protein
MLKDVFIYHRNYYMLLRISYIIHTLGAGTNLLSQFFSTNLITKVGNQIKNRVDHIHLRMVLALSFVLTPFKSCPGYWRLSKKNSINTRLNIIGIILKTASFCFIL